MAQGWTTNTYTPSAAHSSDLGNMEDDFEVLKSSFSGLAAPAAIEAGQLWFDTSKKILKVRNQADNAWLGVMYGNVAFKIWMYVNAAENGWVQDAGITDRVLGIKGGATYLTGGTLASSWTIAGNSLSTAGSDHVHRYFDWQSTSVFKSWESDGTTPETMYGGQRSDNKQMGKSLGDEPLGGYRSAAEDLYTKGSDATHTHSITSGGAWRMAANVGILVYPNV